MMNINLSWSSVKKKKLASQLVMGAFPKMSEKFVVQYFFKMSNELLSQQEKETI